MLGTLAATTTATTTTTTATATATATTTTTTTTTAFFAVGSHLSSEPQKNRRGPPNAMCDGTSKATRSGHGARRYLTVWASGSRDL